MSKNQRKLKVFLCHTSADKQKVKELYQRLNKEIWIDPWLDVAKILPGQHWTSVIKQSLTEADSVIILISSNSINKEGFVQREMNLAWDLSLAKPRNVIYLIPLRLEDCEVPFDLSERQWADYFGEKQEETYNSLLKSLRLRHEQKLETQAKELLREEHRQKEVEANQDIAKKEQLEFKEQATQKASEVLKHAISIKKLFLLVGDIPKSIKRAMAVFIIVIVLITILILSFSSLPSLYAPFFISNTVDEFEKQTNVTETLIKIQTTTIAGLLTTTPTFTPTKMAPTSFDNSVILTLIEENPTSISPGVRPATYTLQDGEYPSCIARRFNVDLDALLQASGLNSPAIYYAGLKLVIPESGAFPGSRSLKAHPVSYTVSSGDETVYSIACAFGDVDPNAIATANGISASAKLTVGQVLQIP